MSPVKTVCRTPTEELALAWWLRIFTFLVLVGAAIASFIFAIVTAIPESSASKDCLLGYRAHCTFTPISTLILLALSAGLSYHIVRKYRARVMRILSDFVDRISVDKGSIGH